MSSAEARRLSHARRQARRVAMQALYQWQMTGYEPKDILLQYRDDPELEKADREYFRDLLLGVTDEVTDLDELLTPHMDRAVEQLDPVERAILRLATFELKERMDIPYRVVINEAVELTRKFGATDAYKYVNGVLDKLRRELREI
ncbi:transcription antitermination factor NusB [Thioalkalivibrio thiocyanodenitrificans]|uniref:transcription antitermination factor NusB n=1 Tax=Thioalkalivibrio thiocyanodenitrificans TaxID=243063 RepID=UPI0005249406|nr:transcription antitermination factor NusB [Thioalkalivibrio thiocyanodenitrificans]